jgi:hypothetical protein
MARRTVLRAIVSHAEAMRINTRTGAVAVAIVTGLTVVTSAPARSDSNESQVRAVLDGMNGSYNRTDFEEFASHLCADMLRTEGFKAGWYESRRIDGPTRITVNSVEMVGDDAVASVRFEAANRQNPETLDIDFVREGAEWKACRYRTRQTV